MLQIKCRVGRSVWQPDAESVGQLVGCVGAGDSDSTVVRLLGGSAGLQVTGRQNDLRVTTAITFHQSKRT